MTHFFVWVRWVFYYRDGNFLGHIAAISFVTQPVPNITPMMTHHVDNFIAMNMCKVKTSVLSKSAKNWSPYRVYRERTQTSNQVRLPGWRLQSADDGIMTGWHLQRRYKERPWWLITPIFLLIGGAKQQHHNKCGSIIARHCPSVPQSLILTPRHIATRDHFIQHWLVYILCSVIQYTDKLY